ncbi:MAG: hypothetical protein COA83_06470 [Methylophaga sp.]|nr:MAG: hypothetical protein COA83_06470 [Methylophaga sp.]
MKNLLTITSAVAIAFLSTTAIADGHQEKTEKKKANPMIMLMGKTSPMPVFMPILVKKADQLGLSKEQQDELAKWRTEHMAPALKLATEIIDGDKAIKQAALDDKPVAEIEDMIAIVLEKRSKMANTMLTCRENSKRILTESQWDQVVALYGEMQDKHNHGHKH